MSLTVSDWFYEGILMDGGLLAIDPVYFSISGGRERWLYRVARKHAGAAGPEGFAIALPTLFEKSGAEGTYRRFKFEMLAIVSRNDIPDFELRLEIGHGEPAIRMIRKTHPVPRARVEAAAERKGRAGRIAIACDWQPSVRRLSEQTMAWSAGIFPAWTFMPSRANTTPGWPTTPDPYAPRLPKGLLRLRPSDPRPSSRLIPRVPNVPIPGTDERLAGAFQGYDPQDTLRIGTLGTLLGHWERLSGHREQIIGISGTGLWDIRNKISGHREHQEFLKD